MQGQSAPNQAARFTEALSSNNDKDKIDIIQKVYTANILANQYDSINPGSTSHFLAALSAAKRTNDKGLIAWTAACFGYYYYSYNKLLSALPYFMQVEQLAETLSPEELPQAAEVYKYTGYYKGTLKDYEQAIIYLKKGLQLTHKRSTEYEGLLFNLGQYYYTSGHKDSARIYYNKTVQASLANKDTMRYAKVLGEEAVAAMDQKNYPLAIKLLQEDIHYSQQYRNDRNEMYAQLLLSKALVAYGNIEQAKDTLRKAKKYIQSKPYLKSSEWEIAALELSIALEQKDTQAELLARRKLSSLSPILSSMDGDDVINKINWQTQKDKVALQLKINQLALSKAQFQKSAFIFVAILLLVILIYAYNNYHRKLKLQAAIYDKKTLSFQIEKLASERLLEEKSHTLSSYKRYLTEKNRQIESLEKEIEKIKHSSSSYLEKQTHSLHDLLDSHLMTEENWHRFKTAFIQEHPDFYHSLMERFPDLSESNQRIILLQNMQQSNKETAQLLGITVDAVKKAKQRMRKKYSQQIELELS